MHRIARARLAGSALVASLALVALSTGCSISESISKSISSPFESSSDSSKSSSESRESAYREDVADYAASVARSGGSPDRVLNGVGSIAAKRGIASWESSDATYVGIGQGLKRARVDALGLETWKLGLAEGDATRAVAIQRGFDQND